MRERRWRWVSDRRSAVATTARRKGSGYSHHLRPKDYSHAETRSNITLDGAGGLRL